MADTEEILDEIYAEEAKVELKKTVEEEETEEETKEAEDVKEADSDIDETEKDDKKSKKKEKKDKKDEKIAELSDRVMRQMAEFENFRKRSEKEKSSMYEMGAKSVIEKILPVMDNFERGIQSIPEDQSENAVAQGMMMIYKQMSTELENLGVKPIEAVGVEFNPDFHNAVMQVESDEYESGFVAQELQKGYTYRDSVVRHSMVAVVQ